MSNLDSRVYADTDKPRVFKCDDVVSPTTGKWKGREGYIMHEAWAHPLNPTERMYAVRLQTGTIRGYITLRVQEKNLVKRGK